MKAFSLIELLVVITIFAIMATLTLPAISSINVAGGVTRAGQVIGDQIVMARQEAANKNRDVEVRFINVTNGLFVGYGAVQLWLADESGIMSPIGRISKLPEGIMVATNDGLSPLVTNISGSTNFGPGGSKDYLGFRFRPTGRLDSQISTNNNFITVQPARNSGGLADNYYTVRVDPVSGRISIFRP